MGYRKGQEINSCPPGFRILYISEIAFSGFSRCFVQTVISASTNLALEKAGGSENNVDSNKAT